MSERITQEGEAPHVRSRANVEAVMRYYQGPWERGDVGVLDETYTDDFIGHASSVPDFDLDGLRSLIVIYRASFSDYRIRSDDIVATEDAVVVRWQSSGRFTASFMGVTLTGEQVVTTGITIYRFREGRIAEHWTEYDSLLLIRALGAAVQSS
jgi:predicted ester cyclase